MKKDANATEPWRAIVASSVDWHEAHATFDDAVAGLSAELRGRRPEHYPHSAWELVEHIRLAQADLIAFMQNATYSAPKWPDDYWPSEPAPPTATAWEESIAAVRRDCEELKAIATRSTLDPAATIPWGDGRTYLRTILVAIDHTAYHVGQLIAVRLMLGAWPAA
jgi:DinB family protein